MILFGVVNMKDFILLVLQIVVFACGLGAFASVVSYLFGWSIRFKGAEVPGDLRATALFIVLGGVCAGIVYIAGKSGRRQNSPE